jgi:hypothetical protein
MTLCDATMAAADGSKLEDVDAGAEERGFNAPAPADAVSIAEFSLLLPAEADLKGKGQRQNKNKNLMQETRCC